MNLFKKLKLKKRETKDNQEALKKSLDYLDRELENIRSSTNPTKALNLRPLGSSVKVGKKGTKKPRVKKKVNKSVPKKKKIIKKKKEKPKVRRKKQTIKKKKEVTKPKVKKKKGIKKRKRVIKQVKRKKMKVSKKKKVVTERDLTKEALKDLNNELKSLRFSRRQLEKEIKNISNQLGSTQGREIKLRNKISQVMKKEDFLVKKKATMKDKLTLLNKRIEKVKSIGLQLKEF